jgi:hypothetical protein
MKQRYKFLLLLCSTTLLLTGCNLTGRAENILKQAGLIKGEEATDYSKVSSELDSEGMKSPSYEGYFILHDGKYYPVVYPDWANDEDFKDSYYENKKIEDMKITGYQAAINKEYDLQIPTLFLEKGDELVYYSTSNILDYYTFVKYKDLGYSLPITNYGITTSGYVYVDINPKTEKKNSECSLLPSDLKDNILSMDIFKKQDKDFSAALRLIAINGTNVDKDYIEDGVLTGLDKNVEYQVNSAFGSSDFQFTAKAEYHFLSEMEMYAESDYTVNYDGVYHIPIPDYLTSGYYMMESGGIFRLVRKGETYDLYNTNKEQFNEQTLYMDEEYTLAHGGYEKENKVFNSEGDSVSNCDTIYSSNADLNQYYTIVPGALGYQMPESKTLADDKNKEDIKNMKVLYYELSPKEDSVDVSKGTELYTLTSDISQSPCTIYQQSGDVLSKLDYVKDNGKFKYAYTCPGEETIKEPVYIAVYYNANSGLKFATKDSRFDIKEVTDISKVPEQLISKDTSTKR